MSEIDAVQPDHNEAEAHTHLSSVEVRGLYGTFDYFVPLDQHERITLIHGPNGYGKTTLLRLINAYSKRRWGQLRQSNFNLLRFAFSDGSACVIERDSTHQQPQRPRRPPRQPSAGQLKREPAEPASLQVTVTTPDGKVHRAPDSVLQPPPPLEPGV